MFSYCVPCKISKISPIFKISTFSEEVSFLNPRSHLNNISTAMLCKKMCGLEAASDHCKNFAKFTGKHLCRRLLKKVTCQRPATLLKGRLCSIKERSFNKEIFCTAAPGDCFWAVLIIVYNFKIISSRETLIIQFLQLTSHSALAIATKILFTKYTCTTFQKRMYLSKVRTLRNYEKKECNCNLL